MRKNTNDYSIIDYPDITKNIEGKKIIPYTQTNSFFYVKNASKPIRFQPIDLSKVNPSPKDNLKETEKK